MSRLFEVREVSQFVGAGRPPDLAKMVKLNDAQWQAWQRLQKGAMRFGGDLLQQGFRTNTAKDRFFVDAIAFVHSFVETKPPPRVRRKKGKR